MPLTLRVPLLGDCTDGASRRPAAAIESLDYEQATNQVFLRNQKRQEAGGEQRHLYGYSGSTATKVAATFLSGIAIGLTAATLQAGVSLACRYRNHLLASLFRGSGTPGGGTAVRYVADSLQGLPLVFLCMLGISVTAVWLVTLVVFYHSPKASGGGVASVMALLNGNAIDGLLSGRVYVTKLLGTATSRMAGLALGVEGPMIHLGACLASMVCHAEHVLYRRFNLHRRHSRDKEEQAPAASNDFLFSNSDHRELVSAGAAAGLAAAFGAPIGGVLFAIEEATSVWSRKLAWRCFLCASVACFTLAVLHPRSQTGMLSFRGITALTNVQWLIQLPLLTIVSACGGLLGSAFNIGKSRTLSWRKKHQGISWRLLEGASVAALTSAALIWLPAVVGSCLPLPDEWDAADVIRHNCGEGQYNDLATGLLSSSVWVIKSLLSLGSDAEPVNNRLCSIAMPCYYSALSLGVLSVTYLLLFLLASNLIVPGGLFMPCIMVGSSFGVLLGLLLRQLLPAWWSIQPGVYAVVCATAMLGAVFRSSISLVAIMIEGTRGIDMLFGIILATIVSNLVAHHVHPNGLYESELEVDSKGGTCYYLRQEPPHALRSQAAEAVMASPVVGLAPLERVSTVLSVLSGTSHNGFPVLVAAKQNHLQHQHQHQRQHQRQQHDGSTASAGRSSGMLQGLVLRSQLLVLLRHGAFCDERGRYISVPVQQSVAGFEEALGCEMEAASQASASGYRSSSSGSGPEESHGMLGELGPAPSMGIGGGGFPSLDRSRGTAAMPEADVLQAAAAAVEREVEAGRQAYLNLTPFMHLAPITVRPHTPADRVHHLFLALSLRHLCVVDWHSRCLGIITRKDLDHAAGSGWWRATHIAPTPHQSPRAGSRSVLDGSSPQAGWTQSFVRSLAVPPRRLMAALQTAFSPATRSPMHADVRGEARDATPLLPAGRPAAASADPAIGFRLLRHAMSEPAHALLRGMDQQATHDAQAAADVEQQL